MDTRFINPMEAGELEVGLGEEHEMKDKKKRKGHRFCFNISLVGKVFITAGNLEEAEAQALDFLDEHGVYSHDMVKEIHDKAYEAGAFGSDPPLCNIRQDRMFMRGFKVGSITRKKNYEQKQEKEE